MGGSVSGAGRAACCGSGAVGVPAGSRRPYQIPATTMAINASPANPRAIVPKFIHSPCGAPGNLPQLYQVSSAVSRRNGVQDATAAHGPRPCNPFCSGEYPTVACGRNGMTGTTADRSPTHAVEVRIPPLDLPG